MTFNENSRLDTSGVQKRGGGRTGVAVGGGSLVVVIVGFLISQFLGVDVTGLLGGGQTQDQGTYDTQDLAAECQTGADANTNVDCRMVGAANSLDAFWSGQASAMNITYQSPGFVLYTGQTQSACGTASNAVGPFYCPGDETMYIDTDFFTLMEQQLGASDGPLAQMYIVSHEWGHHIQYLLGILQQIDNSQTGPTSDGVRLELQADCFAGAWVGAAAGTRDAEGNTLLQEPTQEQIANALQAAEAVGDDHIQEQSGQVHPESFTHGTSEQRMQWFTTGYKSGWQACDTFSIDGTQL